MAEELKPGDRNLLLDRIRDAWNELVGAIDGVPPARLSATPSNGGWSAKDHLAHITVWLNVICARIDRQPEHLVFLMGAPEHANANVDKLNEKAYHVHRHETVEEVIAELKDSHRRTVLRIERMTESELSSKGKPGQPNSKPLIAHIAADTYEHYLEHLRDVRALLAPLSRP